MTTEEDIFKANLYFERMSWGFKREVSVATKKIEEAARKIEEAAKEFIVAVFDDSIKDKEKVDFFDLMDVLEIFSGLNPDRSVRVIYNELKTFIVSGEWSKFSQNMKEQSKSAELTLKIWNLRKSYLGYSDYGARHINLP